MTICHYTNTVSAHQLPLDRELVKLVGAENFRYVYDNSCIQGGAQEVFASEPWIIKKEAHSTVHQKPSPSPLSSTDDWLEDCDLLIVGGIRPIELMERRLKAGKATFYMSERWFKPFLIGEKIPLFALTSHLHLPGWLRLLHPRYFKMARRFVRLFDSPSYRFLSIGPHSARDMRLLQRVMGVGPGGLGGEAVVDSCSGRADGISFSCRGREEGEESRVEERNELQLLTTTNYIPWGDFVAPSEKKDNSTLQLQRPTATQTLRVLWVGRMLKLKHVETIIRAVVRANKNLDQVRSATTTPNCNSITLTLVGDGPEKPYLKKLASALQLQLPTTTNSPLVTFCPPVSLAGVRDVMRQHDIFVFASNGYDGWGAVVPEAMTEGMTVLGTYEAGASAALLPESNLFHCGDWRTLTRMLASRSYEPTPLPYGYTPEGAAKRLLREFDKMRGKGERSCS